ncbi:MAG: nucleotidyltransferase domain-containing protein [Nanoarchaeota archaeon]|nr:nucleotidyltransferase domain-containing protein [Nanoarchaeota archaeon]
MIILSLKVINMRLELNIINLLGKNTEKEFTINEIANRLNEHYSLVNRVAGRLIKEGVIAGKKVGRAIVCSLNPESEKAKALMHLNEVVRTEDFYSRNKEIKLIMGDFISGLKERFKHSLLTIAIFGSYAKGTASKESDIDVLVVCERKKDIADIVRKIHANYGREAVPVIITKSELKARKEKPIIMEIIKYHYILYGFESFMGMVYRE